VNGMMKKKEIVVGMSIMVPIVIIFGQIIVLMIIFGDDEMIM
jgi:hypothetical protein